MKKSVDAAWCAVNLLISAYRYGKEDNDGHMEWNDVDAAWEQAKRAARLRKKGL